MNKNTLQKIIYMVTLILVAIHPIIELDYLLADTFDSIGLPRVTTVIDFIILPLMVILTFYLYENNKKKVSLVFGIYLLIFGSYFILHCLNADSLQYSLFLPNNYVFLISDEVVYTITLMLPLVYVWVFYHFNVSQKSLKCITMTLSFVTGFPILISNLFLFGKSTYVGYTIDNIFSWFSLPYDTEQFHPRFYATKFFFEEGNTIGILMFIILPLLYYFFYQSEKKKEKLAIGALIIVQSISMIILSTRIATYGSALIPVMVLAVYIILVIIKEEKWKIYFPAFLVIVTIMCAIIIPFGPAYQNQQIDALDYGFVKRDDDKISTGKEYLRKGENLVKYSEEWRDFYVYMFEDYSFLMNVTPPVYYTEWYDYRHDPEFWVDLIFDYPLEERVNGRQIENIFTHYKWDPLNQYQKALGLGYGTFMRGSILLERDFAQQYFSYGYIGFILIMAPWLVMIIYLGIKLLLGFKKGYWNMYNILLMAGVCSGVLCSYTSGHTFDEFTTSLVIALFISVLWRNMRTSNE